MVGSEETEACAGIIEAVNEVEKGKNRRQIVKNTIIDFKVLV
jgi:hypothetical protein